MAWKHIEISDVRLALSEDEIERLQTLSVDESKLNEIIQQTSDAVADMFRASWDGKGYAVDPRPHFVSEGYVIPILAVIRYTLFTRFPMSDNYALSEPRKIQYEKAVELLKNPWLNTDKIDWTDPELSGYVDLSASTGSSIAIPWQSMPYDRIWIS